MAISTHVASVLEPAPSAPCADVSPRRRANRFRPRVLLAESQAEVRSALAQELVSAGFEVVAAPVIEDLLGELGEGRALPHLVLVPAEASPEGLDGLTLCERLRADPRTASLPVYVFSREEAPALRERAEAVRADDLLVQPVEPRIVVSLARLKAGRGAFAAAYEAHTVRMPLSQMVQALLRGSRAGRVELRDNEGWLAFRQGHVVEASYEGERGLIALRRLLFFGSGAYAVSFGDAPAQGKPLLSPRVFTSLLLPAVERFTALCALGIPLSARLAVDFKRLSDALRTLPDDVGQVIRLCDGQRTVYTTVLECELPEVTTLEVVTCLYAQGVLVPANFIAEREPPCVQVPPFFEPGVALDEEPFSEAFATVDSRAA
jgi:CheY-like chemotaxis protein